MKIAIAGDHAAPALKAKVVEHLSAQGYDVVDFGTNTPDSVDYPDYAIKVAEAVAAKQADLGNGSCACNGRAASDTRRGRAAPWAA